MKTALRAIRATSIRPILRRLCLGSALTVVVLQAGADEATWRRSEQPGSDAQLRGNFAAAVRQFESAAGDAATFGDDNWRLAGSLYNLGQALFARGRFAEAAQRFDESLAVYRRAFGPHSEPVIALLEAIARLHRDWGRESVAEQTLQALIEESEAVYGPASPRVAVAVARLAAYFASVGRHPEAALLAERVAPLIATDEAEGIGLRIEARVLLARVATDAGAGHYAQAQQLLTLAVEQARELETDRQPLTASLLAHAELSSRRSREEAANAALQEALKVAESVYGSEHPEVLPILLALGTLQIDFGRHRAAEATFKQASAINRRARTASHPLSIAIQTGLGQSQAALGRFEAARTSLEGALEAATALYASGDHRTASAAAAVAELDITLGRLSDAEGRLAQALAESPDSPVALDTLIDLQVTRGLFDAAISTAERRLELQSGATNLTAAEIRLAGLQALVGLVEPAEAAYRRAIERVELEPDGVQTPLAVTARRGLGNLLRTRGRFSAASVELERARDVAETALGRTHPQSVASVQALAALRAAEGRHLEARSLAETALERLEQSHGADHPAIGVGLAQLARDQRRLGQGGEAELLLKRAEKLTEANLDPSHPQRVAVLTALATLYLDQGNREEVDRRLESATSAAAALGATHPRTLDLRRVAARAAIAAESLADAASQLLSVQQIETERYGASDPRTLDTARQLGDVYSALAQYRQAESTYRNALEGLDASAGGADAALGEIHVIPGLLGLLAELGRHDEADALGRTALASAERAYGEDHPALAPLLVAVAGARRSAGRDADAIAPLDRALSLWSATRGEDHPDVASARASLSGALAGAGQLSQAVEVAQQAVAAGEKVLGFEHPELAGLLNQLGALYREQARYGEAELLHQRALGVLEQAFGPRSAAVAGALIELASLDRARSAFTDARARLEQAAEYLGEVLGQDHPRTAIALRMRAALEVHAGHFERAAALLDDALASGGRVTDTERARMLAVQADLERASGRTEPAERLYQEALGLAGAQSPLAVSLHRSLGATASERGDWPNARLHLERAIAQTERSGTSHLPWALAATELATLHALSDRHHEASALLDRVMAAVTTAFGEGHPRVAETLRVQGEIARMAGNREAAAESFTRALTIAEKSLGPRHPVVAGILVSQAALLASAAGGQEAQGVGSSLRRARAIYDRVLEPGHPRQLDVLQRLAVSMASRRRHAEAETLLRTVTEKLEHRLGPQHPRVAEALGRLAEVMRAQGEPDEAEQLHQRALSIHEQVHHQSHVSVAVDLDRLAALYVSTGRYEQAESYYDRSLMIYETELGATHAEVATGLRNLAAIYLVQGRFNEAEPLIERAQSIEAVQ